MEIPILFTLKRSHWGRYLVLAALLPGLPARAWSSKSLPMFEQVHQKAIDLVLKNQLDGQALQWLEDMQKTVDLDQNTSQSFEHAMTGLGPGQSPDTERDSFIKASEAFVRTSLVTAREKQTGGDRQGAFTFLGKALHTLEDASSPSHEGFQSWSQSESVFLKVRHCMAERLYPDQKGQEAYRARLEGAVQWAYDIFTGKAPMPVAFFASGTGTLLLPASYLKH